MQTDIFYTLPVLHMISRTFLRQEKLCRKSAALGKIPSQIVKMNLIFNKTTVFAHKKEKI